MSIERDPALQRLLSLAPTKTGSQQQVAAETRMALLRHLMGSLRQVEGPEEEVELIREVCDTAESMINDAIRLYREAIKVSVDQALLEDDRVRC